MYSSLESLLKTLESRKFVSRKYAA